MNLCGFQNFSYIICSDDDKSMREMVSKQEVDDKAWFIYVLNLTVSHVIERVDSAKTHCQYIFSILLMSLLGIHDFKITVQKKVMLEVL